MSVALRFLLERDRVVQAGAGTGKTHALLTQYLHLCAGLSAHRRPIPPQKICALTFTEKAAAEMRHKLVGRISHICRRLAACPDGRSADAIATDEPALVESAAHLGLAIPGGEAWEQVLASLGGATISTFHSFAASLLRRYAQTLGIDPEFALLDEDAADQRLRETCEELVLSAIEDPISVGHDPEMTETMALLLTELGFAQGAGGDGGLVEVLCLLHRQRAEEGRPAEGIAAAYLPQRLAEELTLARDRLSSALHQLASRANELAEKSAERAILLGGLATRIDERLHSIDEIATCSADFAQIRELFKPLRGPSGAKADPSLVQAIKDYRQQTYESIDDIKAIAISQRAARLANGLETLLRPLAERFAKVKQEEAVLDFSDLLRLSRDLLRDHPEVRDELSQRFQVFLVDEFQDTSPLQAELLTLLIGDEGHSPGRIYIVGDRKQSIYDFRGADVAAFARLCKRLVDHGADEETLSQSYRSLPGVLEFVNQLFARVMQPPSDEQPDWFVRWEPAHDPLTAIRSDATNYPQVELLRPSGGPVEKSSATPPPAIVREAELLAQRIVALTSDGTPPSDIVVLLRRFTHLLHYTTALRRKRIPHYVVRGRGFFAAQEVLDLASLLRLIDDPTDLLALVAVLRSPFVGLSDESLARLHLAGRLSLGALTRPLATLTHPEPAHWDHEPEYQPEDLHLRLPADEMLRLQRFVTMSRLLVAEADRLEPERLLRMALDHSDYLAVLAADRDGEQRLANVERLLHRARGYPGRLRAFVRFVRLQTDPELVRTSGDPSDEPAAQVLGERDNVVRIMTVHQAKGLEFPTVIVAGCTTRERADLPQVVYDRDLGLGLSLYEDGERCLSLPQRRIQVRRKLRSKAESDRLFYVAATRAKNRLIWLGESGSGYSGTWRQSIEELLTSSATHSLITEWQPPREAPQTLSPVTVGTESPQVALCAEQQARAMYSPPSNALNLTPILTAQAAELLACPRRYYLFTTIPGTLSRLTARARTSDETMDLSPIACLLAGTLPQRLLGLIDWQRQGHDLERCLAGQGILRDGPQAQEVLTWLGHLLRSHWFSSEIRKPGILPSLHTAVRYQVPVGREPQLLLHGELDAYWCTRDGTVSVIDVQLASPPPVESAWHTARRALLAHVAMQLTGTSTPVRVGILYLQDANPAPHFELISRAEVDAALAPLDGLPRLPLPPHAVLQLSERPLAVCTRLACELRAFCHGTSATTSAENND